MRARSGANVVAPTFGADHSRELRFLAASCRGRRRTPLGAVATDPCGAGDAGPPGRRTGTVFKLIGPDHKIVVDAYDEHLAGLQAPAGGAHGRRPAQHAGVPHLLRPRHRRLAAEQRHGRARGPGNVDTRAPGGSDQGQARRGSGDVASHSGQRRFEPIGFRRWSPLPVSHPVPSPSAWRRRCLHRRRQTRQRCRSRSRCRRSRGRHRRCRRSAAAAER